MPKITKRTVDAASAAPQGQRRLVWDDEIKGFGLLVLPSGQKSYIFKYRTAEGLQRRATLGKHGTLTPEQARKLADFYRRAVTDGRDPLGEKQERRNAATVGDLLDRYLESERFKSKAPSTQAVDRGRIERHLKLLLGKKFVHALTPGDVEKALADIRDGKTSAILKTKSRGKARVTGGQGTARMAIDLLRTVFNWAIGEKLAVGNPAEHVKTGASGTRDTIIEDTDGYARLFATLAEMEEERRIRAPAADAIRMIALTGARRGEATGLRWSYVDLRRGVLTLPPNAHKTGRKTGKPRIINLPAVAQEIIARQPPGAPDDLVFRPAKGAGPISLTKPWSALRAAANLPADLGLHGLRHSVGSHLAMAGSQAPEIMATLGHSQLSTVVRYIHFADGAKQALAERAATVALAGMATAQRQKPAEAVPLKGTK